MLRVHKIKLKPNRSQEIYFSKACGVARFAYNWALAEWKKQHELGGKPNEAALRLMLNSVKAEQFPWMAEVTKVAPQQAIKNLGIAYKHFFDRLKKGKKGRKAGFPQFKKKGVRDSFRADNGAPAKGVDAFKVDGKSVKLPRIGIVKMTEELRFQGQIVSGTVSRLADGWYIAISVDTENRLEVKRNLGAVGVDLGIKSLATFSDGKAVPARKPYSNLQKRLKRIQRTVSKRMKKGGSNYRKAKAKLAKLHKRIADIRKDQLNKLSTELATNYSLIGVENLNVSGMVKNRCLSKAISDLGFAELRRQLEYKTAMTGSQLVIVDRYFPSSKMCSGCGQIHDMPLNKRLMVCDCGLTLDRDLNAAINLRNYAVSSTVSACGVPSAGAVLTAV